MASARHAYHYLHATSKLGYISLVQADLDRASTFFLESLQIALQRNIADMIPTVIAGLASISVSEGKIEHATRLLAAVGKLTEIIKGSKLDPFEQTIYDHNVAEVRAQQDESEFNSIWSTAFAMTLEQVIDCAMEKSDR